MDILVKALIAMGIKLLTTKVIEDMLLFVCHKVAERTDTKVDDELLEIVEKALKG